MARKQPLASVPPAGAKRKPKPVAFDIDSICGALQDGESLTSIAKRLKCARNTLSNWLNADDARSARAKEARTVSAAAYAEKAEAAIMAARNPFGLAKARELAHHYRWAASKHAPAEFGDKIQADLNHSFTVSVNKIE